MNHISFITVSHQLLPVQSSFTMSYSYRAYLSYYTDGCDEYHATNVWGMVTDIPGYISPFRFMKMDKPKHDDPLVVEASTFNASLNRDCSHRGTVRDRDDGIVVEDVFRKLLDEYSEEFATRSGREVCEVSANKSLLGDRYEDKDDDDDNLESGIQLVDECISLTKVNNEDILSTIGSEEIADCAFAYSANILIDGDMAKLAESFDACLIGLYFRHANDGGDTGLEKFHAFIRRMDDYGRRENSARRLGVTRVLSKHLQCDCVTKIKPLIKGGISHTPGGPVVPPQRLRRCDNCTELYLANKVKDCTQCKMVSYCGRGCQKEHWKGTNGRSHKPECQLMK